MKNILTASVFINNLDSNTDCFWLTRYLPILGNIDFCKRELSLSFKTCVICSFSPRNSTLGQWYLPIGLNRIAADFGFCKKILFAYSYRAPWNFRFFLLPLLLVDFGLAREEFITINSSSSMCTIYFVNRLNLE